MPEPEQIVIDGAPGNPFVEEPTLSYQYDSDRTTCAVCGDLGMVWGGWFSCESCLSVALVEGGRVFRSLRKFATEENVSAVWRD